MSSLLHFQHTLSEEGKAVFNIKKAELNPKKVTLEELHETKEKFNLKKYSTSDLRQFVLNKSKTLTANGNIIKGKVSNNEVILMVCKAK